jgi:bifunctional DNA-binding transcriptional regulator/antitoxin component of YhaV-PrlF toxin-antitoxin module
MAVRVELDLDDEGHILIPAETLDALGLAPGMTLGVEADENGSARLSVQPADAFLADEGGVLVATHEVVGDISDVAALERERRIREVWERTGRGRARLPAPRR